MPQPRGRAGSRTTETAALTRTNTRKSTALVTHCNCGGPGGRPGMWPICQACAGSDRYAREIFLRRLIGPSGLVGGVA